MLHQFMNTNFKELIDVSSASADRFKAADSLFGRIGHVSNKLAVNCEGESVRHGMKSFGECC